MPSKLHGHTVIIDTREKHPVHFEIDMPKSGRLQIASTISGKLDTGDYTLKGYEDLLRIERKAGFGELFNNLINKDERDRFLREMERLSKFRYKYLLIESFVNNDILSLGIPQMKFTGPSGGKVLRDIFMIEHEYGVCPMFVGNAFEKVARYIFELVIKND